jgi:tRNA G18 (ribose-2'-O)-methylase SpoU
LGVSKIFLCGISGRPPHHKISKTALGAEKTIPFEYCKQTGRLIDRLKKDKISIIALEQSKDAISCLKFKPKFPLALIVGNEVKGISKAILKKCDIIIELPMAGKKESLNVSVAFGVAGYHIINF